MFSAESQAMSRLHQISLACITSGRPAAALRRLLQDLDADRGTVQAKLTMARKIKWNDYFAQVVTTISVPCQLQPSRSVRAHDAGA